MADYLDVSESQPTSDASPVGRQLAMYEEAVLALGPAIERLARSYERDPDRRQDLLQDIHLNLWRSFAHFDGRCTLRTWVYRVAHNVAASHVLAARRGRLGSLVTLEDVHAGAITVPPDADRQLLLSLLMQLIDALRPLDRSIVVLYLEGEDAAAISNVTGISAGNVTTKISRIKKVLNRSATRGGHGAV